MDNKVRSSKWSDIFSDLIIKNIPFDYVRKIIIYHNNLTYIVQNQKEFEETIKNIVDTNSITLLSLQTIRFELVFNTRKFKKVIKQKVDKLFSKFFVI